MKQMGKIPHSNGLYREFAQKGQAVCMLLVNMEGFLPHHSTQSAVL